MTDAELDLEVTRLQGHLCIVPGCTDPWIDKAHVEPSGLGGRPSLKNSDNLVGLCRPHHDIFDGRTLAGRQRLLRTLMQATANAVRRRRLESGLVVPADAVEVV